MGWCLQERNAIASVVGNECVPARCRVGRWIAPRIIIDGIEIRSLIIGSAVHEIGHQLLVLLHVRSRVSDWDRSIASAANILLHVASHRLHIWGTVRVAGIVNHFIARQERHGISVVGEGIDCSKNGLEVDAVVRFLGIVTVQGVQGRVGVQDEVNPGVGEGIHAIVVVSGIVDRVDTDGVDSELGEIWNIARASS